MIKFSKYLVFSIACLAPLSLFSQESGEGDVSNYVERDYQNRNYTLHFDKIASAKNLWTGESWSAIALSAHQFHREFKTPQMFGSENSVMLQTESIQMIDSSGYAFYGKFYYKTDREFNSHFNQVHTIPSYGNPFYLFMPRKGKWETQEYFLEGAASKNIVKEKLFAGFHISYSGDLYNKVVDTRNKQTNMSVVLSPSLTYNFSEKDYLSLSFMYKRDKYKPLNSNKYQQPGDDPDYWLYMNQGMGTYDRPTIGYGLISETDTYEFAAQWHRRIDFDKYFTFTVSADLAQNMLNSTVSKPQSNETYIYGKYDYNVLKASVAYTSGFREGKLLGAIEYNQVSGKGNIYNEQQSVYQKSYSYKSRNATAFLAYYPKSAIINKIQFSLKYDYSYGLDLNYGQTYSYTNILPDISASFLSHKLFNGNVFYNLGGSFNYNLDNSHSPVGAFSNIYTKSILNPTLSYATSNYLSANSSIVFQTNVTKDILGEFEMGGSFLKPITLNYINSDTIVSLDDMNNSVYLIFKVIF